MVLEIERHVLLDTIAMVMVLVKIVLRVSGLIPRVSLLQVHVLIVLKANIVQLYMLLI